MCDDDGVIVYVPISNNSLNSPSENVISHRNENKYFRIVNGESVHRYFLIDFSLIKSFFF